MKKEVFLDKDGTLIEDVPYNVDPSLIRLSKEAAAGLIRLKENGYLLIVISNQSGVARGYFSEQALQAVREKVNVLLQPSGVVLDGFYYCPHHPHGTLELYAIECTCRKPKPGMIEAAARDHRIDLRASWMIGDILHDVEAGNLAGCRTILINNGNETEWDFNDDRRPAFVVNNINEAAAKILNEEK